MRILLDTHALLWSALDPDKLPANIATLIVSPANIVSVSIVSYWELAIKTALGKLDIRGDILSIEARATKAMPDVKIRAAGRRRRESFGLRDAPGRSSVGPTLEGSPVIWLAHGAALKAKG